MSTVAHLLHLKALRSVRPSYRWAFKRWTEAKAHRLQRMLDAPIKPVRDAQILAGGCIEYDEIDGFAYGVRPYPGQHAAIIDQREHEANEAENARRMKYRMIDAVRKERF